MKRTMCALAAAAALTLAGCSTDPEPAGDTDPTTTTPAPAAATETPAAPAPEAPPVDAGTDLGSLPAGQAEACADMLPFFASGQDAAGEFGEEWNPDTAAQQIVDSMGESPEWNTIGQDRRDQIAAGIRQAAGGSCD